MSIIGGTTDSTLVDGTKAQQSQQKLQEDLSQFMNLLTAQLKHQDPLDPMNANEFTSQLVQFASVEQQIQGNAHLEALKDLQAGNVLASAVNYVGKAIEFPSEYLPLADGAAEFNYTLPENANTVTINITDQDGNTVKTMTGKTDAGFHKVVWDGTNNSGYPEPDGVYNLTISALDDSKSPIELEQRVVGKVTGISMANGDTSLLVDDITVTMAQVVSIKEAVSTSSTNSTDSTTETEETEGSGTESESESETGSETEEETPTE